MPRTDQNSDDHAVMRSYLPLNRLVWPHVLRRFVVKKDGKLVDGEGTLAGASVAVTDPKSQSRALSLVGSVDWIQARSGATPIVSCLAQVSKSSTSRNGSDFAYCFGQGCLLRRYA